MKRALLFLYGKCTKHLGCEVMDFRKILVLIAPLLLDQCIISVLNVLNSSMISSYGESAVSAVGMVDSLNLFLMNFFIAIGTGGMVVVGQYIGRGDHKSAGKASAQSIASATFLASVLCIVVIVFSQQVLQLLFPDAKADVMENSVVFLIGSVLSYPAYACWQAASGVLRGSGDSKATMIFSVLTNVLYVVGNVVLINLCDLGVLGMAISLNVSRLAGSIVSVAYLLRVRVDMTIKIRDFFRIDIGMQKSIMMIGLPTAMEQVFFNGGKLLCQRYIVGFGTPSIAANSIASSMSSPFYIPGNTISLAIVPIVSQCIGARNPKEGKRMLRNWTLVAMALFAVTSAIMLPFAPFLINIYKPSDAARPIALLMVAILAIGLPFFWPPCFIIPNGLRAAGDSKFTSITALITMWTVRVVFGYVISLTFKMGAAGFWLSMVIEWAVRAVIFTLRMRGTKWYSHKVIKD